MKKLINFVACLILVLSIKAQAPLTSWPELKNFHEVISKTFHPSTEGNLAPIKQRSTELFVKSQMLTTKKIPTQFNKPEVKKAAKDIENSCKKVNDLVTHKGADVEIKAELKKVHDGFHHLLEIAKIEE